MADYISNYTGPEIDDAISDVRSHTKTPAEIDAAVDKVEELASTAESIDDAVDYANDLAAERTVAEIDASVAITQALTHSPSAIDDSVSYMQAMDGMGITPSKVDMVISKINDNNATVGQVLTANGAGGSSWETPDSLAPRYQHNIVLTKVTGAETERIAVSVINNISFNVEFDVVISPIDTIFQNSACPYIATGVVSYMGLQRNVTGIYYDSVAETWKAVYFDELIPSEKAFDPDEWTYYCYTVQIFGV